LKENEIRNSNFIPKSQTFKESENIPSKVDLIKVQETAKPRISCVPVSKITRITRIKIIERR
jgi:hypothetical protein